jgi:GNAT superfamily N-acetyltransferase
MATLGAQVVPSRIIELRRLLSELSADDLGMLDETLGDWMNRPLGREALASVVLPASGSAFLCLMNNDPAGLMVIERGKLGGRVRALVVTPDLRRRGLARTLLEAADAFIAEAALGWLWMQVPASNTPATACALASGYRRYRPQFMRRERLGLLSLPLGHAHVESLPASEAERLVTHWIAVAAEQGDAWCSDLATEDLLPLSYPHDEGTSFLLVSGADEVGVAHFGGDDAQRRLWLWLDQTIWNTPREMNVLKAVLDTLGTVPPALEIEFGSAGHLRASVEAYKALGFKPALRDVVVMAKRVG